MIARRQRAVTLVSTREVGPNVFQQRFTDPLIARQARAGQFLHILPNESHLFRRAFSVYAVDPDAGTFDVLYQIYGEGTLLLSKLPRNTVVEALGPLGNRFRPPRRNQTPVLIGGGLGMAPMRLWAEELLESPQYRNHEAPIMILGARSAKLCVTPYRLSGMSRRIHWATDDGSNGFHGNAVQLFEELIQDGTIQADACLVYGCGPEPMMNALAQAAARRHVPCQVSLERSMPCGFGVCMGCVVETKNSNGYDIYKRVCRDGPVFDTDAIVF